MLPNELLAIVLGDGERVVVRRMSQEILQGVHEKDSWIVEECAERSWFEDGSPSAKQTMILEKKGRRKSWHAIKFERKRKKGIVETVPEAPARQKRPSWWNIFGNQQWPRYGIAPECARKGGKIFKSLPT